MIFTRSYEIFKLWYKDKHVFEVYEIIDRYIITYQLGKDIFTIEINLN